MTALIRSLPAVPAEMAAAFGDEALVDAALLFEQRLAAATAAEGLISTAEAAAIAEACRERPPIAALAQDAAHAGTFAIPLVAELRRRLGASSAAAKVHLGATSQDVADTVLMLQGKAGLALLTRDADRLEAALAGLAETYRETPMLGRTLLQSARPTTFGLKAAGWLLAVREARVRLVQEAGSALVLQLGGPVGSLEGFGGRGAAVAQRLATDLGLGAPPLPWHARRNTIAGLGCALAILTGALGKIARDVSLLAQGEIDEAREPQVAGRGGSSSMPHKRNPTGCQVAISAALRAPHLAATLLSALPQEHERGLGGWQAEGPVLAELFGVTHGALAAMAEAIGGLEVRPAAMAANLAAAGVGDDVGEARDLVTRALRGSIGDA